MQDDWSLQDQPDAASSRHLEPSGVSAEMAEVHPFNSYVLLACIVLV